MGQLIQHHNLPQFIDTDPDALKGCFVDTNLLFAADYDLDGLNEEAVEICETLVKAWLKHTSLFFRIQSFDQSFWN